MQSETVKIMTPEFRASFPALFEPRSADPKGGGKLKYSIVMLFRVGETPESKKAGEKVVSIEPLKILVKNILTEKFGPDRAKWPSNLVLPFRDGNEPSKKDYPGYGPGVVFATASTMTRPGVVDAYEDPKNPGKPAPIGAPSDFYGGCYARATINAYFWEYTGRQGVSLSLQNVQKLRDGEPFGGRPSAENDFDAIEPVYIAGGDAMPSGANLRDL
jgi:hypothetical protein